jgi:hypothetical protein
LGYNLAFNGINWASPTLGNEPNFQTMSENGIQFVRTWLTSAGIFAAAWNPWRSIAPVPGEGYVPFSGLSSQDPNSAAGSETSMIVNARFNPCMFIGWLSPPPAVKANTNYRVRLRYRTENIAGPRYEGSYYGLVVKIGGWLWDQEGNCHDPGTGTLVTGHVSENSFGQADDWRTLEGAWNSGDNHFLPYFYIAMENVERGRAWIDYVAIEEDFGDGQYGPNILPKPWMSHHLYFDQRNSYAFDQILELAHQYNLYLRPVILEKDEWALKRITPDGPFDDENPDANNFYGGRQASKARWLQQAWWRYIQARWGYSTNIHSWELLNEGDPANSRHWALADEFGKYMGCRVFNAPVGAGDGERCSYDHPNAHPVSTSNWHSFPAREFWASPDYPNLGFADLHAYNSTGWLDEKLHEVDAAAYHLAYSQETRAAIDAASGERPTKPVVRGEAGIDFLDEQREQPDLKLDQNGVWLHNFLWSTLDPGGLIELYWWGENIAGSPGPDGESGLYEIFAYFHDFIADIPLNNGLYQDAGAVASARGLRLTGQMDPHNRRAHLWVQNPEHTWRNVVDGKANLNGLSGTVAIDGFEPGQSYRVEWHEFTTQGLPNIRVAQVEADSNGALILSLPSDPRITDAGIKIGE